MNSYTLYPSDFGFLYQECKTCFYNKYKHNLWRPRFNMPSIFTKIDLQMTGFYDNKSSKLIDNSLEEGVIALGGTNVQSKPIIMKEYDMSLTIKGKIDSLILFEDNTIGIIDFKTTHISKEKVLLYFNQLSGYSLCLEHNDENVNKKYEVKTLGLAIFEPDSFSQDSTRASLSGEFKWQEIPQDKPKFKDFLKEVAELLSQPQLEPNNKCNFCKYKHS